jgi:hypothetical protein
MMDEADVIYMYLFPDVIARLHESMNKARLIISYNHEIPQLPCKKLEFEIEGETHILYYWSNEFPAAPKKVADQPKEQPQDKPKETLPFKL